MPSVLKGLTYFKIQSTINRELAETCHVAQPSSFKQMNDSIIHQGDLCPFRVLFT